MSGVDVSCGSERIPIRWVNKFNSDPLPAFEYIAKSLGPVEAELGVETCECDLFFDGNGMKRIASTASECGQVYCRRKDFWALRALESIPGLAFIGEYVGKVVEEQDVVDDDYIFAVQNTSNEYLIDSKSAGNFTRFVNHSCQPNSFTVHIRKNGWVRAAIFALRPIHQGEQITIDYGDDWWQTKRQRSALKCECGTKLCRYR